MTFYHRQELPESFGVNLYNGMPIPMTATMLPPQHPSTYLDPAQVYQPRPMPQSSSSSVHDATGQQAAQAPRNPMQQQQQPNVARPPSKPINKHYAAPQKPKLPTLATPGNDSFGGIAVGVHHPGQPRNPSRHARPVPLLPYPAASPIKFDAVLQRASQNLERDMREVKTLVKESANTDALKAFIKQSTNTDVLEAKIDRLGVGLRELFEEFREFRRVQMESPQLQRGLGGMCGQQPLDEESNVPRMQDSGSMPKLEEAQERAVDDVGVPGLTLQARETKSRGKRTAAVDQPTASRVTRSRARAKEQKRSRRPGSQRA